MKYVSVIRKKSDCGRVGDSLEMNIKAYRNCKVKVAKAGSPDLRQGGRYYEVKCGAGEVEYLYHSTLPYVLYVPVPVKSEVPAGFDSEGKALVEVTVFVDKCEGFLFNREAFLQGMEAIGAIRPAKKGTDGKLRHCLQTFWNDSKQAPHGKLLEKILDLGYAESLMTFEEWLDTDPKTLA